MSRIYEALKAAERQRSSQQTDKHERLGVMDLSDRRCSQRWKQEIDLTIYGHQNDEVPFYERGRALKGNANGGLISLSVSVSVGQDLLLINNRTSSEEICRVVNIRPLDGGISEVAVAFESPHPEFWEIPQSADRSTEMYMEETM